MVALFVFCHLHEKACFKAFCMLDDNFYRLHHENAPQTLVDGSPLMLMVHLKLDHAIRPMQKRGERLFKVRRESYRVNRENAPDRLLHAFPAMIAARWADDRDCSSNCKAKWDESKEWLRLSAWCVCMQMDAHDAFACNLPPFLPPLSPTTPITPYNPPNSPLKQINCLRPHAKMMRQLKATTRCFAKVLSPYNPLSPKATLLASRADRRRELTWDSDWWMVCDYSRYGELTSFCSRLDMYKCCIDYS